MEQRGQKKNVPTIVQDSKAFPQDFFGTSTAKKHSKNRSKIFSPEASSNLRKDMQHPGLSENRHNLKSGGIDYIGYTPEINDSLFSPSH